MNAATPLARTVAVPEAVPGEAATGGPRRLFDPVAGAWADATAVPRGRMTDGATLAGPAAITEDETTVIVPAGFTARGRADGCLDLVRTPA